MSYTAKRLENYINIALRGYGTLPPSIAEIARVTSRQVALMLWEFFAGKQIYIPGSLKKGDAPLVEAVGRAAAGVICNNFGGCHMNIPQGPWCGIGRRWMQILRMLQDSKSIRCIAQETGLSERSVYHCKRHLAGMGFVFKPYKCVVSDDCREKYMPLLDPISNGRREGKTNKEIADSISVSVQFLNSAIQWFMRYEIDLPMSRHRRGGRGARRAPRRTGGG